MYTEQGLAQMKNCGKVERKTTWKSPVESFACALGYHSNCHDGACLSLRMSVCDETGSFFSTSSGYLYIIAATLFALRIVSGRSCDLVPLLSLETSATWLWFKEHCHQLHACV